MTSYCFGWKCSPLWIISLSHHPLWPSIWTGTGWVSGSGQTQGWPIKHHAGLSIWPINSNLSSISGQPIQTFKHSFILYNQSIKARKHHWIKPWFLGYKIIYLTLNNLWNCSCQKGNDLESWNTIYFFHFFLCKYSWLMSLLLYLNRVSANHRHIFL